MYPYVSFYRHFLSYLLIYVLFCFFRCLRICAECIKKQCPFNWMLPLQRPTSEWGSGRDLGLPNLYIFARGHMALCAVSGQFVVPLERHPPSTRARPGPPVPPTWQKDPLKDVPICKLLSSFSFLSSHLRSFLLFSVSKNLC